jgi:hypothetical protein
MSDLIILAASALGVLFMVGIAALLGFRQSGRVGEAELAAFAASEGARVESAVFDANGRGALALLEGGKVLIARVMADGAAARVTRAGACRLRIAKGRLRIVLDDLGYAPLSLKLKDEAPTWLLALAGERA